MIVVITKIELSLPGVSSLKEKRRIIKSMTTKLKNSFNISISEVAENDTYRKAVLGAATVSNNTAFGNQVIAKVIDTVRSNPLVVLTDVQTENY